MFWSHVVYLLVYVALLGYGIAGAFGALLPEGRLTEPRVPLFGLLGFALSNLGAVKLVMVLAQDQTEHVHPGSDGRRRPRAGGQLLPFRRALLLPRTHARLGLHAHA